MNIDFIKSNRFWVLIGIAIIGVLKSEGILEASIADPLVALGLGFIGVRTVDRLGETIKK